MKKWPPNLVVIYYLSGSENWPNKRVDLWWDGLYKRNICVKNDHVTLVVIPIHPFSIHDLSQLVPLVEQELLTLPEHLSSPLVFSGVCVVQSLVFCVDHCLFFSIFSNDHCVLCPLISSFWLLLSTLVSSNFVLHLLMLGGQHLSCLSIIKIKQE
jgi:hypothetical protein